MGWLLVASYAVVQGIDGRLFELEFKPPLSAMVLDKIKLFQNAMLVSLPCERGGNTLRRLVSCI